MEQIELFKQPPDDRQVIIGLMEELLDLGFKRAGLVDALVLVDLICRSSTNGTARDADTTSSTSSTVMPACESSCWLLNFGKLVAFFSRVRRSSEMHPSSLSPISADGEL